MDVDAVQSRGEVGPPPSRNSVAVCAPAGGLPADREGCLKRYAVLVTTLRSQSKLLAFAALSLLGVFLVWRSTEHQATTRDEGILGTIREQGEHLRSASVLERSLTSRDCAHHEPPPATSVDVASVSAPDFVSSVTRDADSATSGLRFELVDATTGRPVEGDIHVLFRDLNSGLRFAGGVLVQQDKVCLVRDVPIGN